MVIQTSTHRAIPWVIRLLNRVPLPYPLTTLILGGVLVGLNGLLLQFVTPTNLHVTPYFIPRQFAPPIITAYSLVAMCYLYNATQTMMTKLRPAVRVDDAEYARLTQTILTVDRRIDLAIGVVGALSALAAFFYQMTQRHNAAVAGQINVMNATQAVQLAVLGLFVGLLVYTGLERAVAMHRLLRKPLAINFFDTRNLAPLNHLSLQISFALIGLVSLPILLFGGAVLVVAVQGLIYVVGALSALVAFALPFWGVHQQMVAARDQELEKIEPRLNGLYRQLLDQTDRAPVAEINALANYRAVLKTAPVWPYQSVRVVAQAAIPILLPLASYLIQQRVAPLISDWLR